MPAQVADSELASSSPLSSEKLKNICDGACSQVVDGPYAHENTAHWTNSIIGKIIDALKEQTKGFKFIVYATLIDLSSTGPKGIRTQCGAYWNAEKDGVWNHKWTGEGTDAIISIAWINSL